MDYQRDGDRFRKQIARLCETLGKPITDELVESWWKALRHVDFETFAEHVDRFLARADEGTKFPRPAQMRSKESTPPSSVDLSRNHVRDYWRTTVVDEMCFWLGMSADQFEPILTAHEHMIGRPLLDLLNELETQDRRDGRSAGQHHYCQRITSDVVRENSQHRTANAPQLPPQPQL
jgi:hypothetical protein